MAKYNKFYSNTNYLMPIMIGVIVGFAFSLLCTPFYDCDNALTLGLFDTNYSKISLYRLKKLVKSNEEKLEVLDQQKQADEFEPRINLQGKPKKPSKTPQKLVRPRYASVELNVRNKLFIGIISTSRMLTNFSTFLNQTLSKVAKKVNFFVNNADMSEKLLLESTPPGVNVVNFNDDRDHLLPFHSLKYVIDNFIENYDWFFFVTDNAYIRAPRLLDLVNHISISQDLYMGHVVNPKESIYCSLASGIIFSNTLLRKILPQMEWCTKNAYSEDSSDNIGRCVLHSANLACTNTANGQNASFHHNPTFDFDSSIDQLMYTEKFNKSITVNLIKDMVTMKKLELYFNTVEMDEIDQEIDKLETNIMETACDTPEGCDSLIWPLGVPAPYKPTSRHEVIRYDYFNLTHLFFGTDFSVVDELPEAYKADIDEAIQFSLDNLNKETPNRYIMNHLINGYKQFDPTRGSSYILDLILQDTVENILIHKRVNLMRPLGLVEIMPMPYVTENSKINLVITFTNDYNKQDVIRFFESYEDFVLEIKEIAEKVNLFIVYLSSNEKLEYENELFSFINEQIKEKTKKYSALIKTSSRIIESSLNISNQTLYFSESYRQMSVIEHISHNISSDGLILIALPCVELKSEFLNRARLNTIKGNQVFFPIPFNEFMPSIIYPSNMTFFPSEVEINKNIGYFNTHTYEFVSFYNSDYLNTRLNYLLDNKIITPEQAKTKQHSIKLQDHLIDLYDLFTTNNDIHILRATDQALKCRWHMMDNCDKPKISLEEKARCIKQRELGLGTKPQLALHLIKKFQEKSKA